MPMGDETLERLKRWPKLQRNLLRDGIMIWCGERGGYWRQKANGYVDGRRGMGSIPRGVGIFSFEEAMKMAGHCGPEKQIEFHSLF